jgi:hypothetical protein
MQRQSRTFKLRLSPAGMDLLIDSHCHLIRSTRALVAWGTTLLVAVDYLDTIPPAVIIEQLVHLPDAGLAGDMEHHLGAPKTLNLTATRIAERVIQAAPERDPPTLSNIYMVALQLLTRTDYETVRSTYERIKPPSARLVEA